jgi:hypothetical protein
LCKKDNKNNKYKLYYSFQLTTFGVDVKQALFCLLQYSKDYSEAAEIGYLVDDALDAGFQYLKLKMLL